MPIEIREERQGSSPAQTLHHFLTYMHQPPRVVYYPNPEYSEEVKGALPTAAHLQYWNGPSSGLNHSLQNGQASVDLAVYVLPVKAELLILLYGNHLAYDPTAALLSLQENGYVVCSNDKRPLANMLASSLDYKLLAINIDVTGSPPSLLITDTLEGIDSWITTDDELNHYHPAVTWKMLHGNKPRPTLSRDYLVQGFINRFGYQPTQVMPRYYLFQKR